MDFMKIFLLGLFVSGLLMTASFSCGNNPAGGANPTPTPSINSVTVTVGPSESYSPSAVTIQHGGHVTWVSGGGSHDVYTDDGTGTATCVTYSSFPVTQVFSQAGTFPYHCSIPGHASCGGSSCTANCTGMAATVVVQ